MRRAQTNHKNYLPIRERLSSLRVHSEGPSQHHSLEPTENSAADGREAPTIDSRRPIRSSFQATSTIFKPSVDFSIPRKTNVKFLHDFLRKQAIMFRHK